MPASSISHLSYNGELLWFVDEGNYCMIVNKIGRIRDMNLNCSLLGSIQYEPVLPGLKYSKVLWVKRNGELVFDTQSFEKAVMLKRFDLNFDDTVDIADLNIVINMMLGKDSVSVDLTGDGLVDIADVNAVINVMLER